MHAAAGAAILMAVATAVSGCGSSGPFECDRAVAFVEGPVHVRLHTDAGNLTLRLDGEAAPHTTCNFLGYVEAGFYDETRFHRILEGFIVQGGGCDAEGDLKATLFDPIPNEARSSGLRNERGTISMARTNEPDSATSQFFLNLADNRPLDPGQLTPAGYAAFGRIVEGLDTLDALGATPTHATLRPNPCAAGDETSTPDEPVLLQQARVTSLS